VPIIYSAARVEKTFFQGNIEYISPCEKVNSECRNFTKQRRRRPDICIILAIDPGKFKSVACIYQTTDGSHEFRAIRTTPAEVHDLIVQTLSDEEVNFRGRGRGRVVIEVGSAAGWVKDLCEALGVEIQIANPNHEAWRWKNIKRKSDKDDGLKMAKLSAMDQLPTVTLPKSEVRQWRNLIAYRHTLVGRRTAIKNNTPAANAIGSTLLRPTSLINPQTYCSRCSNVG